MKRKFILILITLLPLIANAYDAYIVRIYYRFSGNNAIVTFRTHDSNSNNSSAYAGTIIVPPSVTCNGKTYPVTSIEHYAFSSCYNLKSITIPSSVKSIGAYAFSGCKGLEKVIIPDIATWCSISIESNPLYYAHHLYSDEDTEITDLIIPSGVTTIGNELFAYCSGLTSVTIPNSVETIGGGAFAYCDELTNIHLPTSVKTIDGNAFLRCTSLKTINLESVETIGYSAFDGCT